MDIRIKRRPWYVRHAYSLLLGLVIVTVLGVTLPMLLAPYTVYVKAKEVDMAEATLGEFSEYLDVEGVVQPISNVQVNCGEGGFVSRVVAGEGAMLEAGDTILVIDNPELMREIEEQRILWEKQQMNHAQQCYQMEQKSLTLRQQVLQAEYEMARLTKSYNLDKEEAAMGIKSKAQLEVAENEYRYNVERTRLTLESLRYDSVMTVLQRSLLDNELASSRSVYERVVRRAANLVVLSPVRGQLGGLSLAVGQRVSGGERVAELKILEDYKVKASLNEYYIDRISTGLPASTTWQDEKYPLLITRVVPEVKGKAFDVELQFTGAKPDNIRVGKSLRVQVELGKPENALMIPRGDFYSVSAGHYVYRLDETGDVAVRTPVVIGRQNPKQLEVIEGLEPGDVVITSSYAEFIDAARVKLK